MAGIRRPGGGTLTRLVVLGLGGLSLASGFSTASVAVFGLRQAHAAPSRTHASRPSLVCRVERADGEGVAPATNVLGMDLQCCCAEVRDSGIGTGFFRDGHCSTGPADDGRHTVCVQVTAEFLAFSKAVGNDLSTPMPMYMFPGLLPGDRWCLCASRWAEALRAGKAPKVHLAACHEKALEVVSLEDLQAHAVNTEAGPVEL